MDNAYICIRWLVRSAYGISGSGCVDVASSCCCFPCSANQLYQTTMQFGKPTNDVGSSANDSKFKNTIGCCSLSCCFATWCAPCAIATSMSRTVGMPCWMGLCCVKPCEARNIIRYQGRYQGSDLREDCLWSSLSCVYYTIALVLLIEQHDHANCSVLPSGPVQDALAMSADYKVKNSGKTWYLKSNKVQIPPAATTATTTTTNYSTDAEADKAQQVQPPSLVKVAPEPSNSSSSSTSSSNGNKPPVRMEVTLEAPSQITRVTPMDPCYGDAQNDNADNDFAPDLSDLF